MGEHNQKEKRMKQRKNLFILLLTGLFLVIALCGCKGGTPENRTKKENDTPLQESDSSEEPMYGGSVVVGITQDLDSLDPHKAEAAGTKEVLFNVFEGLVKPDAAGNLVAAVASEYHISEDGTVYTFTLRDGITFHNGALVTVNDVVYSIKRYADLLQERESAFSNISEVNIVDDSTVEIVLKEGDSEFIGYLTYAIIPEGYEKIESAPMGTGPFQFVSYSPLESFVMEKNEAYWNQEKAAYLDKVTFKISANADTAFMELKGGAIDIFPYLTDDQANQLTDNFNIEIGNMNLIQGLFLNNASEPFQNQKVREAVNYAIDKQGILDMIAGGRGSIIGSNMFPGFQKYYNDELISLYPTNIEKAKSLLTEAGYGNGLEFTIKVPSNYQYHMDTAQVIVEQLKAAGITAKIEGIEWSAWLNDVYVGRDYQATIVGLDAKLSPRNVLERYQSAATNNFVNYHNETFDVVFEEASKTIEESVKVEKYKELQKILAEDSASVYIQDPSLMVAVNKKLGGYTFYPVYVQDMASVYYKTEK